MTVLLEQGRRGDAIEAGRRALELQPADLELRLLLVRVQLDEGRFTDAEQTCRQGLSLNPAHPQLRARLADACSRQGKVDEARAILDDLIAKEPRFPIPLVLRAALHREAGEEKQAIPLLRKAIAMDVQIQPENVELKVKAAELLLGSQRVEEAARLLREAVTKDPGHDGARRLLASLPRGK
jgi:predicted Zn-dependent protease